ncbi:MAG: hypothetical protein WDO70_03520 [Alphaproteobacteria bacterium]
MPDELQQASKWWTWATYHMRSAPGIAIICVVLLLLGWWNWPDIRERPGVSILVEQLTKGPQHISGTSSEKKDIDTQPINNSSPEDAAFYFAPGSETKNFQAPNAEIYGYNKGAYFGGKSENTNFEGAKVYKQPLPIAPALPAPPNPISPFERPSGILRKQKSSVIHIEEGAETSFDVDEITAHGFDAVMEQHGVLQDSSINKLKAESAPISPGRNYAVIKNLRVKRTEPRPITSGPFEIRPLGDWTLTDVGNYKRLLGVSTKTPIQGMRIGIKPETLISITILDNIRKLSNEEKADGGKMTFIPPTQNTPMQNVPQNFQIELIAKQPTKEPGLNFYYWP